MNLTEPRRKSLRTVLQGVIATLGVIVPAIELANAAGASLPTALCSAIAGATVAATGLATWGYNALEDRGQTLPLPAPPPELGDLVDQVARWAAEDEGRAGPWGPA